jgi:hypothetical protein
MDGHDTADDRMVFDGYVSGQRAHVRNDDVIAESIVMRNVAVSQNVVVGTDLRDFAIACRAIDGNAFAKCIFIADFSSGQATLPFQVLRLQPDAREWKELVAASDSGISVDDDVWMQVATRAQNNMLADYTVVPYLAIGANLGFGVYDRRRMNHRFQP